MRKLMIAIVLTALAAASFSACNSRPGEVQVVEDFLNALVAKDSAKLSAGVCADYEGQALLALDSFQAVDIKLENLSCAQAGTDGAFSLVSCTGQIIATYNGEDQQLDLSARTYQVVQENGTWLVCGER
jgi:hypothetical protein